jgi:TolB-like protein/Flp pilus assembly protein TadD
MNDNTSKLSQFIAELKRRHVFRVAVVYLGSAFVLLEASEMVFPRLALPDWTITLVMVLLGLGFPVALIFSWIFDRTPTGLEKTHKLESEEDLVNPVTTGQEAIKAQTINPNSIAVLPFTSISKSQEDEILSDGITENILTHLAKIGSMKVVSRTSIMQYKNTTKTIREIGNELAVASILEGSVQRSGERIRITGQLIACESDEHLWADSYDKDYEDIFEIQSDVAQQIASALRTTLSQDEKKRIAEERPTSNMEAYDYYLKGLYHWHTSYTKAGNQQSVDNFERATELDPNFAIAYARAAFIHIVLYAIPMWDKTPERLARAKKALEKAMELAPNHPETIRANAMFAHATGDIQKATQEYERAFELLPNDYDTPLLIAAMYQQMGDFTKAEEYFIRTYEMSPRDLDPAIKLGRFYGFMGDFEKSEHYLGMAMTYHPSNVACYAYSALHQINAYGDTGKARQIMEQVPAVGDNLSSDMLLYPKYYAAMYEREYAEAIDIARLFKRNHPGSEFLGLAYYNAGKHDMMKTEFTFLKSYYEDSIKSESEEAQNHTLLGLALAAIGERNRAFKHYEKAESLFLKSRDMSYSGQLAQFNLARTLTILGEADRAIKTLDSLVNNPGHTTVWDLRLDPIFDPLRENISFKALIA